jgi:ABC-2 type transport system ATP-binding protein
MPTSGSARVAGFDVATHPAQVRRRIGYVGQGNGAGHTQRVRDEMYTQAVIYGMDRTSASRRADELLEALDLSALAKRKVSDLSGGQRRRLDVAMGLVHAPSLLFLDEPTTGLDPQNRANLWERILRMRAEHEMTIMLTTHYLDEADSMAERVVVVDHGEIIADDTAENLKTWLAGDRVTLTIEVQSEPLAATYSASPGTSASLSGGSAAVSDGEIERLLTRVDHVRELTIASQDDAARVAEMRVDHGPQTLPILLRAVESTGLRVTSAELRRPTLDDVFLGLTGRSLRESATIPAPGEPPVDRVPQTSDSAAPATALTDKASA